MHQDLFPSDNLFVINLTLAFVAPDPCVRVAKKGCADIYRALEQPYDSQLLQINRTDSNCTTTMAAVHSFDSLPPEIQNRVFNFVSLWPVFSNL